MLEKGSIIEFKNHKHSMRVPIVVCINNTNNMNTPDSVLILFTTGKNWNRFDTPKNPKMKTWLKYL